MKPQYLRNMVRKMERDGHAPWQLEMAGEHVELPAIWQCDGPASLDYMLPLARAMGGPIYWLTGQEKGPHPHAHGIAQRGINHDRQFWLQSNDDRDMSWVLREILRHEPRACILAFRPMNMGMQETRKLRLAAESGHSLLALMSWPQNVPGVDARMSFGPNPTGFLCQRSLVIKRHHHRRLPPKQWHHEVQLVPPSVHLAAPMAPGNCPEGSSIAMGA